MSDVWQGPGWWLAADGKWYPADGGPETDSVSAAPGTSATSASGSAVSGAAATTASTSGWQAVVSDDAPTVAPEPDSSAVPEWTEPAVPAPETGDLDGSEGWTSGFEGAAPAEAETFDVDPTTAAVAADTPAGTADPVGPDIGEPSAVPADPDAGSDAAAATTVAAAAGGAAAAGSTKADAGRGAIERDEAWRKPNDVGTVPNGAATPSGVAEVVDLAVPDRAASRVSEPEGLPWGSILKGLAIVGVLVLIALIANALLDDDSDVTTDPGPDTTSSAPSSTEATTTESTTTTEADTTTESTTTDATSSIDPVDGGTEVSVFDLRQGDCIESEIGSGQVQRLIAVDCSEPHEFEVYREVLIDNSITEYDEEAISAQAEDVCRTSLAAYIPEDDDRDLMFKWFQPTEESWNQPDDPDRVITCLLFDEGEKLVGRAA